MDINKYIGIPWEAGQSSHKAADCWGLVTLVCREQFGVRLNNFFEDGVEGLEVEDIDLPEDFALVRAVSTTSHADHWGLYYKGRVLNACAPHSAAPTFKNFASRWPVLEFYKVVLNG